MLHPKSLSRKVSSLGRHPGFQEYKSNSNWLEWGNTKISKTAYHTQIALKQCVFHVGLANVHMQFQVWVSWVSMLTRAFNSALGSAGQVPQVKMTIIITFLILVMIWNINWNIKIHNCLIIWYMFSKNNTSSLCLLPFFIYIWLNSH